MTTEERYKSEVICLIANIPVGVGDNDPILKERMQLTFDMYFNEYMAIVAGKTTIERIEGCSFTVPDIACMKNDYIDEQVNKLTRIDLMSFRPTHRIRIRRYLAFLNEMKNNVKPSLRDTIEKACNNDIEKVKIINTWLIENGYCHKDTLIYKDQKSGKNTLACFLLGLQQRGYTEKKLSNKEIQLIAQKSYGFDIGLSTIEHTKFNDVKFPSFPSFIVT